jgi:hypothetical protein
MNRITVGRLALGYIAGALAVLVCSQPTLAFLSSFGPTPVELYSWRPTEPWGVPRIVSLCFWGGLWGCLFVLIEPPTPRRAGYWLATFAFGAVIPTLVGWFIVAPIRGVVPAGDWNGRRVLNSFLANGTWALGTALLLVFMARAQERFAARTKPRVAGVA